VAGELSVTKNGISDREYVVALLSEMDKRFDQRMNDSDKASAAALQAAKEAVSAALAAAEKAVLKAEIAADAKFELLNELRGAMKDQAAMFATITSMNSMDDAHSASLKSLTDSFTEKMRSVESRLDKNEGADKGLSISWMIIIGAVGIIGTIIVAWNSLSNSEVN